MPRPLDASDVLYILADGGQVPSDSEDDVIYDEDVNEDVNEAELDEHVSSEFDEESSDEDGDERHEPATAPIRRPSTSTDRNPIWHVGKDNACAVNWPPFLGEHKINVQ